MTAEGTAEAESVSGTFRVPRLTKAKAGERPGVSPTRRPMRGMMVDKGQHKRSHIMIPVLAQLDCVTGDGGQHPGAEYGYSIKK